MPPAAAPITDLRPLLKWAGGKYRLGTDILGAFQVAGGNSPRRYIEPFLGGGSVFLALAQAGALDSSEHILLADTNERLIGMYRTVRGRPEQLNAVLDRNWRPLLARWGEVPDDEKKILYYNARTRFNALPADSVEGASLLLVLNRICFNGLYRENKSGEFNVPVGRYKTVALPDAGQILGWSRLLQRADMFCLPFGTALTLARLIMPSEGALWIYCDPPYVPLSGTANFTAYSAGGFGPADQAALAAACEGIDGAGAVVVLSNHDAPATHAAYRAERGWEIAKRLDVSRSVSAAGGSRVRVGEVLMRHVAAPSEAP